MKKESGIFIPFELFKNNELNCSEVIVLSLYRYYSKNGKYNCCSLSNQQIADLINMSRRNVIDIKNHLKQLGLIKSENSRNVVYVDEKMVSCTSPEVVSCTSLGSEPEFTSSSEPEFTGPVSCTSLINVKKKKNIKKEIKKEEKTELTNFDFIVNQLSKEYKTPEKIEYIKEQFGDRIEKLDVKKIDLSTVIIQIKNDVMKRFINPVTKNNKVEEKKDFYDMF